jgi:uncharacterized protein (TIGR02271 family)
MTHQDYSGGMAMHGNHTVSAFYDSYDEAEAAATRLRSLGVPDAQIRLTQGREAEGHGAGDTGEDKGFFAMLGELFFPDDDRSAYAEGLSRGGHLLTVTNVSEDQYDAVIDILDDEGAVDMDERTASWREEGWSDASYGSGRSGTGADEAGSSLGAVEMGGMASAGAGLASGDADGWSGTGRTAGSASGLDDGEEETLEIAEERLRVGKRDASRGSVRVRTYVVEEPVSETVNLREDRVEIERRPVDRSVGATEGAFQERSIEAEEYREEAVVAKEARVVEEVSLRRTSDEHEETVSDTLRHTEVEIEDDRDDSLPSDRTSTR